MRVAPDGRREGELKAEAAVEGIAPAPENVGLAIIDAT